MSTNYEIISKEEVSQSEVLDVINNREKETELTYREDKVKEFLKKRTPLDVKEFNKLKKELENLEIPRLEDAHLIKIIDLMPINGTQLRAITSHSGVILVDENVTKILDVLKAYRK